jgi:hypothetical protein
MLGYALRPPCLLDSKPPLKKKATEPFQEFMGLLEKWSEKKFHLSFSGV